MLTMEAVVTCAFWRLFQKATAVLALQGSTCNLMGRPAPPVSVLCRILIAVLYHSYILPVPFKRRNFTFMCLPALCLEKPTWCLYLQFEWELL